MIDLKKIDKYEETSNWIELETLYLDEILLFNSKIDTYHHLGMIQERLKKYDNAITSYNMATFRQNNQSSNSYYRLGYVFDVTLQYKEACGAFLMMKKILLPTRKQIEDNETVHAHKIILFNYIKEVNLFTLTNWKILGKKAEELKCWDIAEYGYKEYIARADDFEENIYFSLGYALSCQKKYEEASQFFKEQKIVQSLDTVSNSNYEEYRNRFSIEDKVILYESDKVDGISGLPYEMFLRLEKNVHFDTYQHIWAVNDKEKIDKTLRTNPNIIFITKNSDLYRRYLARAKYLIFNQTPVEYFQLKEEQVLLNLQDEKIDLDEYIKSIFFVTINSSMKKVNSEDDSLYYRRESELIDLMNNKNQKIEESLEYFHHKFDASNFAGIEILLNRAIETSINNSNKWILLKEDFLNILEDVKMTDASLWTSLKGDTFIGKIKSFSKRCDNSLEFNLLPYQVWFVFSNLFIFARLYKKYQLARTNARDSILETNEIHNNSFARYKINALIEGDREEEYTLLRQQLLQNDKVYIQKYLQLLGNSEYYFNRTKQKIDFYNDFFTMKEQEFTDYIENKSIAIVGPLQSGLNVGKEIDSHDVVLRFNYSGLKNFSKEEFGEKTDMSFYIAEILLKDKLDTKKVSFMNELDWVIMDTPHSENDICFLGLNTNIRQRYSAGHAFATTMLKGAPSGIQRVIMDLLRFNIGSIKVFNTNLFLENNYAKAYRSRGKLGADYFNFFWHDPLSNFIFLQRLKASNTIDADEVLSKILVMSENEYIDALELRYGSENSEDE